jgi:hypothetical protein
VLLRAQLPPSFRKEVDIVRIEAVVLDRDGQPVAGLAAGDSEITENGAPREIVA